MSILTAVDVLWQARLWLDIDRHQYLAEVAMSRVQLALNVNDIDEAVSFSTALFGTEPAKRRPGYANFAIAEPPLKLVLIEGEPERATVLDHLGVEVACTDEVGAAAARLSGLGLATAEENDTTCCYAVQDKVWVRGPGGEPWEVYTVEADAPDATIVPPDHASGRGECGAPPATDGAGLKVCC